MREASDRRGRAERGRAGLLDRDSALRAVAEVLAATQGGIGQALLLESHAGMGKTRLYEAALDEARARGLRVLRAAGAELEDKLAFGVAGQLLRAQLSDLPADRREVLLTSAPERVRTLAGVGEPRPDTSPGRDLALSHGLFTLLASADENRPALIAIDDLHWCDIASLEFVLYLLHRLDELPMAFVMTRRPGIGDAAAEVLDRIATHPRVAVVPLTPLGQEAVGQLVSRALGERHDRPLVEACRQVTAGNPFYLRELLLALEEEHGLSTDELARHARALAPDAVTRTLRVRVGRVGARAAALARAIAILGDDVPLRRAAALSGLRVDDASRAADGLAAVEVLLAREPLRFVHPLVRRAIELDIPASERAGGHLDAARLLYADGADAERVAAHLLLGRAQGDAWVVQQLRAAAADVRTRGPAEPAIGYLQRALEEPPPGELRTEVLAELGAAEVAAGIPSAVEHLAAASRGSSDPVRRAELALQRGQALYVQGFYEQAAAAYDDGLSELEPDLQEPEMLELHDALQTGFVASASLVPRLQASATARSAALLGRASEGPSTHGQRMLLAQSAIQASLSAEPAETVKKLAELGWDDGRLLERESADGFAWSLLTAALTLSGELERAIELADAVLEDARSRASPLAFATASFWRSVPYLEQGRITAALADLELARDARRYGWRQFSRAAAAVHCQCLTETGEYERADEALVADAALAESLDLEDALRLSARAELRLAQGRPEDALRDALASQRGLGPSIELTGFSPWRTTAALSALALGDRSQAREFASQDRTLAEQTGVLHARIRSLRVEGLCEQGEGRLELLRAAADLGSNAPARLESVRAGIELGAALRRANRRVAAREPLQWAADMAQRGGATGLYERARTELAATGARPRRQALLSGPASLTASERRIADLAADGQSNREIAQALFVTPKTVEYHLRNAYRKLDVQGRHDLAQALAT